MFEKFGLYDCCSICLKFKNIKYEMIVIQNKLFETNVYLHSNIRSGLESKLNFNVYYKYKLCSDECKLKFRL